MVWLGVATICRPAGLSSLRIFRQPWGADLVLALLAALLFLTKQSTAMGAWSGMVACFLLWDGPAAPASARSRWFARILRVIRFALATGLLLLLLAALLSPWMSVGGFFHDVFRTATQAKGGASRMFADLASYAVEFKNHLLKALVLFALLFAVGKLCRIRPPGWGWSTLTEGEGGRPLGATSAAFRVYLLFALAWLLAVSFALSNTAYYIMVNWLLWPSLLAGLAFTLGWIFQAQVHPAAVTFSTVPHRGLAVAMLVSFPAAVTHSLSVSYFRWHYDNNFLIAVALAFPVLAWVAWESGPAVDAKFAGLRWWAGNGFLLLLFTACWSGFMPQFEAARHCTVPWSECAYLQGAMLPESASALRQCIQEVRQLAPDAAKDELLLLPADPDLEARFERPAPRLSSAIVFFDQYIDEFVAEDFARLSQAPPKIIVLGPRNYMLDFAKLGFTNPATMHLVDLVSSRLLPRQYHLADSVKIIHKGRADFMDIYVRDDNVARSANQ